MNGDEVRDVRFPVRFGYDAAQVDDLLRCIAAELDAGRPVGPLIANTTFRLGRVGYESAAVDWFLYLLLRREDHPEPARMDADPWRDLAVGNHLTRSRHGDLAERTAAPSQRARWKDMFRERKYLAQECKDEWRGFGQQPGTHLRWVRAGAVRRELRTAEQQTIASLRYGPRSTAVSIGRRTFTWKQVTRSARPDIDEIIRRSFRGYSNLRFPEFGEFLDEMGMPILYTSGTNYRFIAEACIVFPDRRWLRFPVRGTTLANGIMTAVDQAGNKVARYRAIGKLRGARLLPEFPGLWKAIEITIHPGQQLTEELVLAIAISARWLRSYFASPGRAGGGG